MITSSTCISHHSVVTKSGAWEGWSKRGTGWTGKSWGGRHVSFPVLPDGSKDHVIRSLWLCYPMLGELRQFDSIVIEVSSSLSIQNIYHVCEVG